MAEMSAKRQLVAGQLAGMVAHDLNNLLATILGCLELMERRLDDPERLKVLIKRSSDAVERAAGLTSRLAHFARRQPQPRLLTDVNTVIADLAPLMASALGRRIRVSSELSATPALAQLDPGGLEITLLAICLAVRAAIPETGQVTIATQVPESSLILKVTAGSPGLGELNLDQARSIAAMASIAIQLGQATEGVKVLLLFPHAG